jgi:hypothetical protein
MTTPVHPSVEKPRAPSGARIVVVELSLQPKAQEGTVVVNKSPKRKRKPTRMSR